MKDDRPEYSGKVAKILSLGGMRAKVMVRDGETDQRVIEMLGGGVLGLPWSPGDDVIPYHVGVNISQKKNKTKLGPELSVDTVDQLDGLVITKRVVVSMINSVYDPLGFVTPITIKYKIMLRECGRLKELGWDDPVPNQVSDQFKSICLTIKCLKIVGRNGALYCVLLSFPSYHKNVLH